MYQKSQSDL